MSAILINKGETNTLYESYHESTKFWYRVLRIENYVVWVEHPSHAMGHISVPDDVGLLWNKTTLAALPQKSQDWLKQSKYFVCLVGERCICDSLSLFHAGCQCGHLKLIKEAKKKA